MVCRDLFKDRMVTPYTSKGIPHILFTIKSFSNKDQPVDTKVFVLDADVSVDMYNICVISRRLEKGVMLSAAKILGTKN